MVTTAFGGTSEIPSPPAGYRIAVEWNPGEIRTGVSQGESSPGRTRVLLDGDTRPVTVDNFFIKTVIPPTDNISLSPSEPAVDDRDTLMQARGSAPKHTRVSLDGIGSDLLRKFLPDMGGTDTLSPETVQLNLEGVFDNPLDGFIDITYNMALSMVDGDAVFGMGQDLSQAGKVYFACTGEVLQGGQDAAGREQDFMTSIPVVGDIYETIGRMSGEAMTSKDFRSVKAISRNHMFVVQDLVIRSVMAVSAQNPELALVTDIKMKIHEPYGLSLESEIRNVAAGLGYRGSASSIIWRLDIWFSGYDERSGVWVPVIPIRHPYDKQSSLGVITHFCYMTTMEASVSHTGTDYDVVFVPVPMIATRSEQISLDGFTIEADSTFGDFCFRLEEELNRMVDKKSSGRIKKRYEVVLAPGAEEAIRNEPLSPDTFRDERQHADTSNTRKVISVPKSSDVLTLIRTALSGLNRVQMDLDPTDPQQIEPSVMYVVRPEVITAGAVYNPITNSMDGITYRYVIEKFINYRMDPIDTAIQNDESLRRQRVMRMIEAGALRRVYDYMFTGTNTEVLSFDVKLRNFYFKDLWIPFDNPTAHGVGVRDPNLDVEDRRVTRDQASRGGDRYDPDLTESVISMIEGGFGGIPHSSSGSGQVNHYRVSQNTSAAMVGNLAGEGTDAKARFVQNFQKRIFEDLISLENFEVRGDPGWLVTKHTHGGYPSSIDQVASVVRINLYAPNQDSYMDPNLSPAATPDLMLSGYYQILTIDHTFSGGEFKQKMTGYRLQLV